MQATGWGKSAVYWIAAGRAARRRRAVPTLVVSPLLALMRDQVAAAGRAGLRAATLNSANIDDWDAIEARARAGRGRRAARLAGAAGQPAVRRDACCRRCCPAARPARHRRGALHLVDWGHDFRPDYQRIARLLARQPAGCRCSRRPPPPTQRVTADVAAQLGADTLVLRGHAGPRLAAPVGRRRALGRWSATPGSTRALRRAAGLGHRLRAHRRRGRAARRRSSRARGHDVAAYTGQHDDRRARAASRTRCARNELKAVVATSALGMGYDKPDLAFCVHVGSPASPVDYYQQVGRAGRALDTALVVLLPGEADERIWEYFATATIPDPDEARPRARRAGAPPGAAD